MTDKEQKEVRSYCAFLLEEYGFYFSPSDPVIPALYVIHKEMQLNHQSNERIAGLVKDAAGKINPTVFHFDSPGEAFQFQLGAAVKWIMISLPIVFILWIGAWYWSMESDVDKARTIIQASGRFGEFVKRAEVDKDGYYFIEFTAPKGDSIAFFSEFQRVNAKTIRVFLGKK